MVRRRGESTWTIYVKVQVTVVGDYLVTTRPLSPGKLLSAEDLSIQSGHLTALPTNILTAPNQAVGRTAFVGMPAGQPLRADFLRTPAAVKQGQTVKVVSRGAGVRVSTDGRSLNNAADGQVAQARITNGQTLSGIARPGGFIEISP